MRSAGGPKHSWLVSCGECQGHRWTREKGEEAHDKLRVRGERKGWEEEGKTKQRDVAIKHGREER